MEERGCYIDRRSFMRNFFDYVVERVDTRAIVYPVLAATLCVGTLLAVDDGSGDPGFVPPPASKKLPPAPGRTVSSAETLDACCCCPITPMSRTEAKKPPRPPVLVTKLKDDK